jgi:signal transduction histidine kinase
VGLAPATEPSGPSYAGVVREPVAKRIAWSPLALTGAALGIVLGIAAAVLGFRAFGISHDFSDSDLPSWVVPITFGILGGMVAWRERRNATGWMFLFIAIVAGLQGVSAGYARAALATHPAGPGAIWALWLDSWLISLVFPAGALALLLLVFPNGHLPSRRWRPFAGACVVLSLALAIPSGMFEPGTLQTESDFAHLNNPIGLPAGGVLGTVVSDLTFLWVVGLLLLVAAAAALVVRMRRSRGDERQQLKWIAYAVIVSATIVVALEIASLSPVVPSWAADIAIALGFGIAVPVAAGIAIFRYRLYDIDLVISRTLVYGALAVFITAVYIGIAVGIGALIGGGGKPNLGLSILATAIVAIGFQPLRAQLQKVANRLVYGTRATPYEVLSQFAGRVAESYAIDEVLPRMAAVLADGTRAERAVVWLRSGTQLRAAAAWPPEDRPTQPLALAGDTTPEQPGTERIVEVRQQNELLGALSVTTRARESLTPIEEKLLSDLAHQAGLVLRNVRLTADLQRRLEELRASRQRLVAAQDDERRRIERNLHDGAQQHLVALKVKLGLVEMLASRDPARAASTIGELKHDADEALETLRDLARGIYPPLLADQGLAAALRSQAAKATVPVHVDADGIGRYSQETEAALYFCTLEAIQNVQKYAHASSIDVRLRAIDGHIGIDISDDGIGFDPTTVTRGAGLTNMEDRLDALGGSLHLESTPGEGTTLHARVPDREAILVAS